MFQTVEGNHVPNLQDVKEGYTKRFANNCWVIQINVSAEHIDALFCALCSQVRQPSFLLFEHGTNQAEEEKLRTSEQDPLHKDVFYLDGLDFERFHTIYAKYRELLIHDGEICFGYGSHDGTDEVYVGSYKMFYILTDTPEKYEDVLQQNNFPLLDQMKTVWETFTLENPGQRLCIKKNGIDIYEMIAELKKEGLYLAERREE